MQARPYVDLPAPSPQETLEWMRRLALQAQSSLKMRDLAAAIVRNVWPRDYASEYTALLNWVRRNIRYIRDPRTVEQVQTPDATLAILSGDCDDMATLLAALVGHLGGASQFCAGAFKEHNGRPVLSHVWCEALEPVTRTWIVLDPVPGQRVHQMLGGTIQRLTAPGVS